TSRERCATLEDNRLGSGRGARNRLHALLCPGSGHSGAGLHETRARSVQRSAQRSVRRYLNTASRIRSSQRQSALPGATSTPPTQRGGGLSDLKSTPPCSTVLPRSVMVSTSVH